MISAILLAAGKSKRMMGENKLIKKIKGTSLIQHSIKNILSSSINELIVVLGHQKEIIEKLVNKDKKIKIVFNKDYENGMSSSIKLGLNHLSKRNKYFFICLGDMPMVTKSIYEKLIESKNKEEVIVPMYKGQQGNPILFSHKMKKNIMTINGDMGAKQILEFNSDKVLKIEMDNKSVITDYNTQNSFII